MIGYWRISYIIHGSDAGDLGPTHYSKPSIGSSIYPIHALVSDPLRDGTVLSQYSYRTNTIPVHREFYPGYSLITGNPNREAYFMFESCGGVFRPLT